MKRLGVVLIVLGLVAILVAVFPNLAGEKNPAPGFGPQQKTALIAGIVVAVVGLGMAACGKCSCAAPPAEAPPAAAPEPPAAAPEPPAEAPPSQDKPTE